MAHIKPVIQLIALCPDGSGFSKVWGWLVDGERSVTFWRRRRSAGFSFKISDTYAGDRSIADKVDEKLEEHGYEELPSEGRRYARMAERILSEYEHARACDAFHGV